MNLVIKATLLLGIAEIVWGCTLIVRLLGSDKSPIVLGVVVLMIALTVFAMFKLYGTNKDRDRSRTHS